MFHDAVQLLLSPYPNIMSVYSTRDMKSGLIGKHDVSQKVGVSADLVKHITGKIVAMRCPLVLASAESAPCMRGNTVAFREPYAQLLMASAVPLRPD
jgi:hypothetical protein